MNEDYVHKRDLVSILERVQKDIEDISLYVQEHKDDKDESFEELNRIISTADRDIRLKTTTIVRSRLNQSKQISQYAIQPNFEQLHKKNKTLLPALPTLDDSKCETSNCREQRPTTKNVIKRPITALSVQASTPVIRSKTIRKPLPTVTNRLPTVDAHDPLAPLPNLSQEQIERSGYQRLTESRLMKEDDIQDKFDDIVAVAPFTFDFTLLPNIKTEKYILDKRGSNTERSKTEKKPIEEEGEPLVPGITMTQTRPFIIFINGEPLSKTFEYIAFRKSYSHMWEQIEILLTIVKQFCEMYGIAKGRVDIKQFIELCKLDPDNINDQRVSGMFLDPIDLSKKKSKKVGFGFIGPHAEDKAATCIQSIWRGFASRRLLRTIRRNNAAARIIQRAYRQNSIRIAFAKQYKQEWSRKVKLFDSHQDDPSVFNLTISHALIHLVETGSGLEMGRLLSLSNQNTTIIIFTRKTIAKEMQNRITAFFENCGNRIHFISCTLKKPPPQFSIADMLASDNRSLNKIKGTVGSIPGYIVPDKMSNSVLDVALKLNAYVLAPSLLRISMLDTRDAIRRLLEATKTPIFEGGSEVYDRNALCKTLTDLAVTHLWIQSWAVRNNRIGIGWLSTLDFTLLEQLRHHKELLDPEDVENDHFRDLLTQNLVNDLGKIIQNTGNMDPENFLRELFLNGATVEAAPVQVRSSPEIAFFVPPTGQPELIGTAERLFISAFEPFASIHPSFTVPIEELRTAATRVMAETSLKRLIGYNVATYFYSTRNMQDSLGDDNFQLVLTADDFEIQAHSNCLRHLAAQIVSKRRFDPETMSLGPNTFVYVQERLDVPGELEVDVFMARLRAFQLPVDEKLFVFPFLLTKSAFSLVAVEENVEKLILLAHRTLRTISESIFKLKKKSRHPLVAYSESLGFLKKQFDGQKELLSTAMMQKVKISNHGLASTMSTVFGDELDLEVSMEQTIAEEPEKEKAKGNESDESNSNSKAALEEILRSSSEVPKTVQEEVANDDITDQ